jgi:predicted nucleic acid-binding protein
LKLTFVDAGVLIAAARGSGELARCALSFLDDPDRTFASSIFVRLEVLPKPIYLKRHPEAEFYGAFFRSVQRWLNPDELFLEKAFEEACTTGLSAIDALHVTAASVLGADEFLTAEARTKPIFRATSVPVRTIRP